MLKNSSAEIMIFKVDGKLQIFGDSCEPTSYSTQHNSRPVAGDVAVENKQFSVNFENHYLHGGIFLEHDFNMKP